MSAVTLFLVGDAALLGVAVVGAFTARRPFAPMLVYGAALAISAAMLALALAGLLGRGNGDALAPRRSSRSALSV